LNVIFNAARQIGNKKKKNNEEARKKKEEEELKSKKLAQWKLEREQKAAKKQEEEKAAQKKKGKEQKEKAAQKKKKEKEQKTTQKKKKEKEEKAAQKKKGQEKAAQKKKEKEKAAQKKKKEREKAAQRKREQERKAARKKEEEKRRAKETKEGKGKQEKKGTLLSVEGMHPIANSSFTLLLFPFFLLHLPISFVPIAAKFVAQLYKGILGRVHERKGLDFWVGELRTKEIAAFASLVKAFFNSKEFKLCQDGAGGDFKSCPAAAFVEKLYNGVLGKCSLLFFLVLAFALLG